MPIAVRGLASVTSLFQRSWSYISPSSARMLPQPETQSASSRRLSEQLISRVTRSPTSKLSATMPRAAASEAVRMRLSPPMLTLPPSVLISVTISSTSPPSVSSSPPSTSKRTNQPSPDVRVETVEKYSLNT